MKFVKRISLFFIMPMGMYALGFYSHMKLQEEFYPGQLRQLRIEGSAMGGNAAGIGWTGSASGGGMTDTGNTSGGLNGAGGINAAGSMANGSTAVGEPQVIPTAREEEQVIGTDTQYIIEELDLKKNTSVETKWKVPDKYIGMNRQQFVKEMELYQQSPSLKDQELGFVSAEVVSFSRERVVVRKSYMYQEWGNSFYLVNEKNYVVVYCDDLKTVYMITNISLDSLPDELKQEIIQNKYVASEEELYNFLESYSS